MQLPKLKKPGRYAACIILLVAAFVLYEIRLFQWQIVQGEEFAEQARSNSTDFIKLTAARGEILDKNGEVLAGNRTTYRVVYDQLEETYSERNRTIIKIIDLLEERGEKWRDILPITVDADGNYAFIEGKEDDVASLKSSDLLKLADYATADDCMSALMDKFDCAGYSKEDIRVIASVRYSMTKDAFSRTNPYVIAEDVSSETVGVISEKQEELQCIKSEVNVVREYGEDGTLAPHVIGTLGAISSVAYDKAVEEGNAYSSTNVAGYSWTDTVGTDGIESAFETELRGKNGKKTISLNDAGGLDSSTVTEPPVPGNTVRLTLDSKLQKVANESLEKNVKANVEAKNCIAGAAVAIDIETGGVLVSSTYPTYDIKTFSEDIGKLSSDEVRKPLYNRALNGTYTPGSSFKPMVALAALNEGIISTGTTYFCKGVYDYYPQYPLRCFNGNAHGTVDIYSALEESCNGYFSDVGRLLTISKMDAYAEYFALGTKTGVELPESLGVMTNPTEYEENWPGVSWTDGLTSAAAIGQADNAFTPVQLATYCATIANGGKRLQTHFLDQITNYAGDEVVKKFEPNVVSDAELSPDVVSVVIEGMREVAANTDGTAYSVFGDYGVSVAAKTGTAEVSGDEEPNLTFIAFAPVEDPKIAVAVVMEKGNKGAYAQNVCKDIFDAYFGFVVHGDDGKLYDREGNLIDEDGKIITRKEDLPEEPESGVSSQQGDSSGAASSDSPIPDEPYRGENHSAPDSTPENSTGSSGSPPEDGSSGSSSGRGAYA